MQIKLNVEKTKTIAINQTFCCDKLEHAYRSNMILFTYHNGKYCLWLNSLIEIRFNTNYSFTDLRLFYHCPYCGESVV